MTAAARDEMRGSPCEICDTPMIQPCYDEHPETGVFRGWICHDCNKGLGFFAESIELLKAAAEYLRKA
jgi:hypothetical protein